MIPVTRPYLPDREKLQCYIDGIYARQYLTNNGPLVQELTRRLENYLGVENLLLVSNGTLALQIAYRALGISGQAHGERVEAITTPFSFAATASSLKWEGVEPVFGDIDPDTWCLDPASIEPALTTCTRAIVPVHVFGNACEVEAIEAIARRHRLKVIYDGAHAFGVTYRDRSLLVHGDATTLSFHATKLFHTVEGGAIIFKHKEDLERAALLINFGISGPDKIDTLGINAKMNEFQAAMGLCVLDEIEANLKEREAIWRLYAYALGNHYQMQRLNSHSRYNYAYFPVACRDEKELLREVDRLARAEIQVRRYFYPSLDQVQAFSDRKTHSISDDLARRVMCLPVYQGLDAGIVLQQLSSISEVA
ncbi:DegT/DnrJ/EryC1/StrS family aminotransferase [Modicisalibacter xianhensis]|uniref:dTDP-4-amino-4,6-dideoxygalactose transaminase n=1 Tax=Modicisalibacter xianhensis TaxID=442341 RepID=A0A1I2ZF74_9GAMM|nr:DegT/DnrJ/EryC1/StrS family aminotransferase [Halomonas xianhensis]SFH36275.1 dTDP-4-amino-4,6-dideoxygalactose transaminase [Halomonas xianhensis]